MPKIIISFIMILSTLLISSQANARGAFRFGDDEQIHFIQKTNLTGQNTKKLYLGYKTTTKFFIAGAYITKNGYVLAEPGGKRYYKLTGEKLAELQKNGQLPTPLPTYHLSTMDYAIGYSLWILLAVLILWSLISLWLRNRKAKKRAAFLQSGVRRILAKAILADGQIAPAEMERAAAIYTNLIKKPLDPVVMNADLQWVSNNLSAWDGFVKKLIKTLPVQLRGTLVMAFAQIIIADGAIQDSEQAQLEEFARQLGVPENDISTLLTKVQASV